MLHTEVPLAHVSGRTVVGEPRTAAQAVDECRIERGSRPEILRESAVELKRWRQPIVRTYILCLAEESVGRDIRESIYVIRLVEYPESRTDHRLVAEGESEPGAGPELVPTGIPNLIRPHLPRTGSVK